MNVANGGMKAGNSKLNGNGSGWLGGGIST